MADQLYKTRSVKQNDTVRTYSKSFAETELGIQNSKKYIVNKSPTKVPGEKLNCILNKKKKTIKIYTGDDFPIKYFTAIGTSSLLKLKGTYKTTGSFYKGFGSIIKEIIETIPKTSELTIDFNAKSKTKILKKGSNKHLILSAHDYSYIHGLFATEKKQVNQNALSQALNYLGKKITIPATKKTGKEIVSKSFKSIIHKEIVNNLSDKEIHDLLFELYEKRYDALASKIELFKETDTYKLDYIEKAYKQYILKYKANEGKWQDFFEKNFSIINPSYKYVIREVDTIKNLIDPEAKSRPIDFIVIDIYNNIELIELKTPSADIVSKVKDRNNYYLTQNCTKACTQLEKYLIRLESNQIEVEKLIKQKISDKYGVKKGDLNIFITRPKAKLIIGMLTPLLVNNARHQDFQLQRHSFKNIEIVTFDEIFDSLSEINKELKRKPKRKIGS